MINKNNIEEMMFDYFEGNLSSEEKSNVDSFVKENPEYQADFDAWSQASLPQENFVFERVDELLVPTGKAKPFLFARWKTAFVFIAASFGLSAAFLLNNSTTETNKIASNDLSGRTRNFDAAVSELVSDNIGDNTTKKTRDNKKQNQNKSISKNQSKNQSNNIMGEDKTLTQFNVETSSEKTFINKEDKIAASKTINKIESTNNIKTNHGQALVNNTTNNSSATIDKKANASAANKGSVNNITNNDLKRTSVSVGSNSDVASSKTGLAPNKTVNQAKNTKAIASQSELNRANSDQVKNINSDIDKYISVDMDIIALSEADYLSNPSLKKGKDNFEAYEKNEVKFFNDKNPYVILPNALNLNLNSSFVGNSKGIRFSYLYNYQYPELNDNFSTNVLAIDGYVKPLKGGLGLVLESDVLGHNKFSTKGIAVMYSPKFKLSGNVTLEPSVRYGVYQKSISWNQLKTSQMVDPRTGVLNADVPSAPVNISKSTSQYSNYGGGLLLNTSKFYVGVGFENLFNPVYDLNGFSNELGVQSRVTAQAGGSLVPVKKLQYFVLQPAVYFIKTGNWENLWFSNTIVLNSLFIGTSYSTNKDLMLSLGYNNDHLRINYAYGLYQPAVAGVKDLSSHQIGLVFLLKPKR